jgi:hypothetical protein
MRKRKLEWYAFRYEWNKHELVFINVLENMEEDIIKKIKKGAKDKWKPVTDYNSFKDWIKADLMYYYWSKSEHEVIIADLFDNKDEARWEKHDIWWQLEPNLDRICEYIINRLELDIEIK